MRRAALPAAKRPLVPRPPSRIPQSAPCAMSRSPHVPHGPSRTPSRSGTPIPHLPSPSRLPVPPVLHSAPSLTSLRVYSRASSIAPTPRSLTPPIPSRGGESSSGSSSAMNLNIDLPAEGILIPEPEAEVDTADGEQATATARIDDPVADEEAKRHLRDQLRRTLSHKTSEVQATGEPSQVPCAICE